MPNHVIGSPGGAAQGRTDTPAPVRAGRLDGHGVSDRRARSDYVTSREFIFRTSTRKTLLRAQALARTSANDAATRVPLCAQTISRVWVKTGRSRASHGLTSADARESFLV